MVDSSDEDSEAEAERIAAELGADPEVTLHPTGPQDRAMRARAREQKRRQEQGGQLSPFQGYSYSQSLNSGACLLQSTSDISYCR